MTMTETIPKKEDRRVRRTRKLLTQALTELLQHKQVNEMTVTELTNLADVNRGTFYLYYKDIYDMIDRIEDDLFTRLEDIIAHHEQEVATAETRPVLLELYRFLEENQEMCRVLLSPNGDMNFLHRLNGVLREKCLRLYLQTGKTPDEQDFDYRYSFIVFGCAGMIRAWVNRNCPERPEQMADMTNQMIREGGMKGFWQVTAEDCAGS